MSKRLRAQGRNQNQEIERSSGGNEERIRAAASGASQEAGQSPKKLMLLMWGIPLLLVLASVLVQRYT